MPQLAGLDDRITQEGEREGGREGRGGETGEVGREGGRIEVLYLGFVEVVRRQPFWGIQI